MSTWASRKKIIARQHLNMLARNRRQNICLFLLVHNKVKHSSGELLQAGQIKIFIKFYITFLNKAD